MIVLLLDSTYKFLSVGLAKDNVLIDKIEYEAWQRQSEFMIQEIYNILKRNKLNADDVNEIVVTNGPGSYTGIRIALTIAKIFSMAKNISCYVLSSLKVLQHKDKTSICLINARSNRSYVGIYKNNECIMEDKVMRNEEVMELINNNPSYTPIGDIEYLGLDSKTNDILSNMIRLKDEKYKVEDILKLKAVYLKD